MRGVVGGSAVAIVLALGSALAAPAVIRLTPSEWVACREKGGRPVMVLSLVESCVWPTGDSGKVCRDKSDCEGYCEAPLGTQAGERTAGRCSKTGADRIGGCSNLVERGRSAGDICVD